MHEIERVKDTIRKLLDLAADDAAAEGEVNNAIHFARKLMLKHQLSEEDCRAADDDALALEQIARAECGEFHARAGGRHMSAWEDQLAGFCCQFVGGVKCYVSREVRRVHGIAQRRDDGSLIYDATMAFYGIAEDAALAQRTFVHLAVVISTMARLKWRGVYRGPGRSYCLGFVDGLFEQLACTDAEQNASESRALVVRRSELVLAKERRADQWLEENVGKLRSRGGFTRPDYHAEALTDGKRDGATTSVAGRAEKLSVTRALLPAPR